MKPEIPLSTQLLDGGKKQSQPEERRGLHDSRGRLLELIMLNEEKLYDSAAANSAYGSKKRLKLPPGVADDNATAADFLWAIEMSEIKCKKSSRDSKHKSKKTKEIEKYTSKGMAVPIEVTNQMASYESKEEEKYNMQIHLVNILKGVCNIISANNSGLKNFIEQHKSEVSSLDYMQPKKVSIIRHIYVRLGVYITIPGDTHVSGSARQPQAYDEHSQPDSRPSTPANLLVAEADYFQSDNSEVLSVTKRSHIGDEDLRDLPKRPRPEDEAALQSSREIYRQAPVPAAQNNTSYDSGLFMGSGEDGNTQRLSLPSIRLLPSIDTIFNSIGESSYRRDDAQAIKSKLIFDPKEIL